MLLRHHQVFSEARRTSPSIIYIPHIQQWWETAGPPLRVSFSSLLCSIPSFSPILLLATCSAPYGELDPEVRSGADARLRTDRVLWNSAQTCVPTLRFSPCSGWSTARFTPSVFPPGRKEPTSSRISSCTRQRRLHLPTNKHVGDSISFQRFERVPVEKLIWYIVPCDPRCSDGDAGDPSPGSHASHPPAVTAGGVRGACAERAPPLPA